LTSTAEHICTVRHALALDERRVKFLPEYINHGDPTSTSLPIDIKEVWFAGSHSDMYVQQYHLNYSHHFLG
jgi:hypothetical protein